MLYKCVHKFVYEFVYRFAYKFVYKIVNIFLLAATVCFAHSARQRFKHELNELPQPCRPRHSSQLHANKGPLSIRRINGPANPACLNSRWLGKLPCWPKPAQEQRLRREPLSTAVQTTGRPPLAFELGRPHNGGRPTNRPLRHKGQYMTPHPDCRCRL